LLQEKRNLTKQRTNMDWRWGKYIGVVAFGSDFCWNL